MSELNNKNNIQADDLKTFYLEEEKCWRAIAYIAGHLLNSKVNMPSTWGRIKQFWADGPTKEDALKNLINKLISELQKLL